MFLSKHLVFGRSDLGEYGEEVYGPGCGNLVSISSINNTFFGVSVLQQHLYGVSVFQSTINKHHVFILNANYLLTVHKRQVEWMQVLFLDSQSGPTKSFSNNLIKKT
eukprot:Lithocolla_globosa_v1_NODE_7933_length_885_cov_9.132530.p1 type:complete len:107 gc:universal NODE_7933_length_885_cov_9.132530:488-808(+)